MTPRPLTSAQVADRFGVTSETVGVWADEGKIPSFRTPGGHRRFLPADVDAFLAAATSPASSSPEVTAP